MVDTCCTYSYGLIYCLAGASHSYLTTFYTSTQGKGIITAWHIVGLGNAVLSARVYNYPPYVSFFLSGYRYLGDGGTDRREILHDGIYRSQRDLLPFKGGTPGDPKSEILGLKFGHLTANISKTVSRSVICQLELNISSMTALGHGAIVPPRGSAHPLYGGFVSC